MRVVILHYAGPPVVGGVESTIDHHARGLAQAGYVVDVVAGRGADFHPQVTFHPIAEIDSRHPEVLEVGQALAQGELPPTFAPLRDRLVAKLRPILEAADLCLVHNVMTLHKNLPLTAALRCLSDERVVPMIAWSHDFAWLDPLYTPGLHPGYAWDLLRQPWPGVHYVVVSEHRRASLAELLRIAEAEIRVITPGVDAYEFLQIPPMVQELAEKLGLLKAAPLMLLPARITRRKNIQFAIRVTAALQGSFPQVALVVTGPPGPHNPKNAAYLEALQNLRDELGIGENIHFLYDQGQAGNPLYLPDEAIAGLYRLADLLLFPSLREGFGIPVLEAGLAHLPVFAADIPPVRESAADLAHLFDPNGDPGEVAQAIANHLASDRGYQLRKRVLGRFTWQAILEKDLIPLIMETMR